MMVDKAEIREEMNEDMISVISAQGIRYGYPECCIKHCIELSVSGQRPTFSLFGYMPCDKCRDAVIAASKVIIREIQMALDDGQIRD